MPTHYQGTAEEQRALDLFIKLSRASASFFARVGVPMTEAGLTPTQFGVLETLLHLGPATPSQLAAKHLKSRNNLSVVIENLDREGLIRRERCPSDRRVQWIHLTDLGREKIVAAFPIFAAAVVKEASVLSSEEQDQLSALLKKLGLGHGESGRCPSLIVEECPESLN